MVRIEQHDTDVIIWGKMVGTTFNEKDQRDIIMWFIRNKPKMVRTVKREVLAEVRERKEASRAIQGPREPEDLPKVTEYERVEP